MIAETAIRPLACPVFLFAPPLHSTKHLPRPSGDLGDGDMASIPQTLQLTKTAQKQQRNGGGNSASIGTYCGMAETDQPARYNSKLMNSIWGRYNEHSVHNFKSLQCGAMATASGAGAQNGLEVGQAMMQPPSPSLCSSSAMKRRMRELGEAVSANFMDNLNQY
ncbi:uncharacterized protein LOC123512429 [Portunus trituberculatus]|uniref:uncharacterized protein LOC123512429 n=1 Tax=Portunus trituberculatus TaxID=210409 RepID=UPI001E1CE74E|nr:uncharacterized protein LOC123512429 [Portunus trituberculatus]